MSETTLVFDTEIHPRFRDLNMGNHIDSVEAIRVIDEARIQFLRFAPLAPNPDGVVGLLGTLPSGVGELVAAQRVDYHAEMRFAAFRGFDARLWVSRVGGSSFDVSTELHAVPDAPPSLIAVTTVALWDHNAQRSWAMSEEFRAVLTAFLAPPVPLRG